MPISDITPLQRRKTQEAQLMFRILGFIATNTIFKSLNTNRDKMVYYFGIPTEPLPVPSVSLIINGDDQHIYGTDSINFKNLNVNIIVAFRDDHKCSPIEMDSDGYFKNEIPMDDTNSLAVADAYVLKQAMEDIIEVHGFDNNWYFWFCQHGDTNEYAPENVRITLTEFQDPKTHEVTRRMFVSFKIMTYKNASHDVEYAQGDAAITVTSDGTTPVQGATVVLKGKDGNYIEDDDGIRKWYSDAAGLVTIEDVPAQWGVTVEASKTGTGTATETDKDIPNEGTLTLTVTLT